MCWSAQDLELYLNLDNYFLRNYLPAREDPPKGHDGTSKVHPAPDRPNHHPGLQHTSLLLRPGLPPGQCFLHGQHHLHVWAATSGVFARWLKVLGDGGHVRLGLEEVGGLQLHSESDWSKFGLFLHGDGRLVLIQAIFFSFCAGGGHVEQGLGFKNGRFSSSNYF